MRLLLVALGLALGGCAGFSNLQRADVLDAGRTRIGVAPLAAYAMNGDAAPAAPLVATVRHGLGHDLEVGGRLWLAGVGVGAKYQLVDTPRFVLSLAPEVLASVGRDLEVDVFDVSLPLLAGVNVGEHQLVVGARVLHRWWQITNRRDDWSRNVFPSGIVGFDVALSERVHLLPEVVASYWPAGRRTFWVASLGFAVELGGR